MAKLTNFSFHEWTGGASEEEIQGMIRKVRIRFWIFLALSLIPVLNFFLMGITIFCYNNLSILKSRGRSNGSDLLRFCMLLYGFFLIPIIEVQLLSRINKLGNLVLGW